MKSGRLRPRRRPQPERRRRRPARGDQVLSGAQPASGLAPGSGVRRIARRRPAAPPRQHAGGGGERRRRRSSAASRRGSACSPRSGRCSRRAAPATSPAPRCSPSAPRWRSLRCSWQALAARRSAAGERRRRRCRARAARRSLLEPRPAAPRSVAGVGVDGAEVLGEARSRFLRLQAAWDAGDVRRSATSRRPTCCASCSPCSTARVGGPSRTDVITLHAELLEPRGARRGLAGERRVLRPHPRIGGAGAVPFRELWMLAATKDGAPSWRLARQQALF